METYASGLGGVFEFSRTFRDRVEAGERLAERLEPYRGQDVLVLGLPRGGVVVAEPVARRLHAELDVLVARKLGAPGRPELAIGAVTADGGQFLNEEVIRDLGVSAGYLKAIIQQEMAEARRREQLYRDNRPAPRIQGRTVILVDDGLATGATMRAAVRSVRQHRPDRVIVAVPVGATEARETLAREADDVVLVYEPVMFWAVGQFYQDFRQLDDAEVQAILRRYRRERETAGA